MGFDAFFIRHAESAGNAGLVTQDPGSIPLTELGLQQAEEFGRAFPFKPSVIAVSPFLRAQQTAAPLLRRFPRVEIVTLPIQEFTYLAPAQWRGTTNEDRRHAVEAFWSRGHSDHRDGEGAESFADFMERVEFTLRWLQKRQAQQAVLVCHEFFIRAVLWRCFCPSLEQAIGSMPAFRAWQQSAKIPNVSTTRVTLGSDGRVGVTLPFGLT
ncbi:broad specificity phosphatase PhoE [Roseimicrobium gellanilyticum]|uniref:Broad specificity phosphatase PhoE n=1 Tax=Roseimicrobium gellanilyticum TaxID=748857 RepID=A0A366H762_9BACT|nr:histidine phosphatase family protein [Roseimicrobium gellanilyticum]RBP38012.1 broad specificity phosphatase PhoE [Roseimicrobium gellanilyticum]